MDGLALSPEEATKWGMQRGMQVIPIYVSPQSILQEREPPTSQTQWVPDTKYSHPPGGQTSCAANPWIGLQTKAQLSPWLLDTVPAFLQFILKQRKQ